VAATVAATEVAATEVAATCGAKALSFEFAKRLFSFEWIASADYHAVAARRRQIFSSKSQAFRELPSSGYRIAFQ
jgi:hypothetical protein